MTSRSELCLFVGYTPGTNGYLFYSPSENKTFISTNAQFFEDDYIRDAKSRSRLMMKKLQREGSSNSQENSSRPVVQETQPELTNPRRSGRVSRKPDRHGMLYVEGKVFTAVLDNNLEDPLNYNEAMASSDANL